MSHEVDAVARTIAQLEGEANWQRFIPHAEAVIAETLYQITAALVRSETGRLDYRRRTESALADRLLNLFDQMHRSH